jgi:hypothetical protein
MLKVRFAKAAEKFGVFSSESIGELADGMAN